MIKEEIKKEIENYKSLKWYETSRGTTVSDSVALNITGKTLYNDDPYGVLYGTGNVYSPEQLNAIECVYYGRNCPTLHIKIDN